MVKLVARSPLQGEALGAVGGVVLTEVDVAGAWSVAPFVGQVGAVDAALRGLGLGWPAPGQVIAAEQARAIWSGRGRALVVGAEIPQGIEALAAVTTQGDGVAALVISGKDVESVLARLVPVDLRLRAFPVGATARTMVNHMAAQVTRTGAEAFEIMVMRSMGHTLVHELREAAQGVAARG